MKKSIALTLITFGSFLSADAPMPNHPPIDPFELLNNMDPKELDKLMDDLAKMSPEEIKYYEDLGKQMFKDSGYDLDEIAKTFPAQQQPTKPVQQAVKQPEQQKPTKAKPSIEEPSKKEKDSLLRMVKALSESLASIRQKAASDETLHPHLAPLQQELDLLTAYVNRLDYERHLKHFADKEFAALKTKLRKMSSMLEEFDNNLIVPELTLRKPSSNKNASYGGQMSKATSVLQEFKQYMSRAFTSDTILTDIENLFKKHDQEALVIKKELEEQQKKASEQVKKLNVTNTGKFAPIPKVTNQPIKNDRNTGGGSYGGGSRPVQQPHGNPAQKPTMPQQQAHKGNAPAKPGEKEKAQKDAATREKKEAEFAEVPLTTKDLFEKAKKDLLEANVSAARVKENLLQLADSIATTQNPAQADREMLLPVVQDLKKACGSLTQYTKKADTEKDKNIVTGYKKTLSDIFKNQMTMLTELHEKFATLSFTGPFTEDKQAAMEDARTLIEGFQKYFNELAKQFKTTRAF